MRIALNAIARDTPNWVDLADLKVQQQLAEIAGWMMWLTVGQLVLAIAGTIALIVTLRESRRATATAMRALHVQQSAERAVLIVKGRTCAFQYKQFVVNIETGQMAARGVIDATVVFGNVGPTLGFITRSALRIELGDEPILPIYDVRARQLYHDPLDPDGERLLSAELVTETIPDAVGLFDGQVGCFIYGFVEYVDIFDLPHALRFAYRTVGPVRDTETTQLEEFGGDAFWRSPSIPAT